MAEGGGAWFRLLPSADLPAGALRKAHAGGRPVLLARLESGRAVAASPVCPHEGADLAEGTIYMGALNCPRHHYLYDLETGENRYPKNVFPRDLAAKLEPLPLYEAKEEEGWIWVWL